MKPYVSDPDFTLYLGDARTVLAELEPESVHCVVTSPPYWGLRDYGTGTWDGGDPDCDHSYQAGGTGRSTLHEYDIGLTEETAAKKVTGYGHATYKEVCGKCGAHRVDQQLGLEATPDAYIAALVSVFQEVRRVLRADGTCWLNLGDSYANDTKWGGVTGGKHVAELHGAAGGLGRGKRATGLKAKDLVGIPWRVAFALQDDGWYLRSDIIWSKPNPMPESVTDRPTKAHEYVFLLAKSARYFYDAHAIRELAVGPDRGPGMTRGVNGPHVQLGDRPRRTAAVARRTPLIPDQTKEGVGRQGLDSETFGQWSEDGGRNRRSVWEVATEAFAEAHFATFPQALVEPCVKAGTSEHGVCPECGAPWERATERVDQGYDGSRYGERAVEAAGGAQTGGTEKSTLGSSNGQLTGWTQTTGWQPTCACSGVDLRPIVTPTGEGVEPDPTLLTGRAGMNRTRNVGARGRPMTRYEQAEYARQLRASPARPRMEDEAGAEAFAHYIRTDESGARPVPPWLLETWIEDGLLERVTTIPDHAPLDPVPATVLDPFMGSGTVALVARRLGRRSVGIELNPEYGELSARRLSQLPLC